jgi:hypothetical protein
MKLALLPLTGENEVCIVNCDRWQHGCQEFILALRGAIKEWVETTNEGKTALAMHYNIIAIKDMPKYAPNCFVTGNALGKIMAKHSIPRFDIITAKIDGDMDNNGVSGTTSLYKGRIG